MASKGKSRMMKELYPANIPRTPSVFKMVCTALAAPRVNSPTEQGVCQSGVGGEGEGGGGGGWGLGGGKRDINALRDIVAQRWLSHVCPHFAEHSVSQSRG